MTVALIGGLVAMYGVTIPLLISARRHAKSANVSATAANEQVTNEHTTNLRDDMDSKHVDNRGRLSQVERRIGGVERGVQRIEDHLGIERTQPRAPRKASKG